MKVCPKCGSEHISEMATSGVFYGGVSGYSGYQGIQGVSGISGYSGRSGSGVVRLGIAISGMPSPTPAPPAFKKSFSCSRCGWCGKEADLMDDFKFEIKKVLKEQGIELPTVADSSMAEQRTHNPLGEGSSPSQPIEPEPLRNTRLEEGEIPNDMFSIKPFLSRLADKILGEKIKPKEEVKV